MPQTIERDQNQIEALLRTNSALGQMEIERLYSIINAGDWIQFTYEIQNGVRERGNLIRTREELELWENALMGTGDSPTQSAPSEDENGNQPQV
jgi:hypothetical protein